jgi:hypothetical protein
MESLAAHPEGMRPLHRLHAFAVVPRIHCRSRDRRKHGTQRGADPYEDAFMLIHHRLLVVISLLCLVLTRAEAAPDRDPAEGWKLPKEEAEKWVTRVRRLVPEKGWTVRIRGNDIVIQREQAVKFVAYLPNSPDDAEPMRFENTYRITLRFGRKTSQDEYETMVAENRASDKRSDELRESLRGIPHKFQEYAPSTDEEKAAVKKYHEAVKKLIRHELPDLYTPDRSIKVIQSWHWLEHVDKEFEECGAVEKALLHFFGVYDGEVAKRGWGYFKAEKE